MSTQEFQLFFDLAFTLFEILGHRTLESFLIQIHHQVTPFHSNSKRYLNGQLLKLVNKVYPKFSVAIFKKIFDFLYPIPSFTNSVKLPSSVLVILSLYRSSRPEVFLVKCVLKICIKFTGENPYQSVISIKLLCKISCLIHFNVY